MRKRLYGRFHFTLKIFIKFNQISSENSLIVLQNYELAVHGICHISAGIRLNVHFWSIELFNNLLDVLHFILVWVLYNIAIIRKRCFTSFDIILTKFKMSKQCVDLKCRFNWIQKNQVKARHESFKFMEYLRVSTVLRYNQRWHGPLLLSAFVCQHCFHFATKKSRWLGFYVIPILVVSCQSSFLFKT